MRKAQKRLLIHSHINCVTFKSSILIHRSVQSEFNAHILCDGQGFALLCFAFLSFPFHSPNRTTIMGNQLSLTPEQIDEMKSVSEFTEPELKRLFKKFKKLDTDKSGTLSVQEFLAIPELEHNPLVRRVVATFDSDKSGEVDFQEFISALSVFATVGGRENKFQFTFKVYDVDGDNFISNADLFHVLKAMVGSNLNDVQLQQLVDRTILQGDKDKDGKLSYAEFVDMVKGTDIEEKLKIEL
jgi:serine/threonine-protein phosphatase 2B regulatory subunit